MQQQQPELNLKKIIPIAVIVFSVILVIALWSRMTVSIESGEGGVEFRFFTGVNTDVTYGEGFHFINPLNKMFIYDVRQQEVSEKMSVLSSNGLEISLDISMWYQPVHEKLSELHQEKGQGYLNSIVRPSIRSATRSVIGRYTPEQIYSTKRDAIQEEIYIETRDILVDQYVQLNEVLVRDVTLPPTIKTAIEKKLKQEQESLEYEFKLIKESKEAERRKIDAEGKAEANRILNASLTSNILKEKGIEATVRLAESPNAKVVIIGNSADGMPIILGDSK
ncbi:MULTISPECIES: prohibitin family protein [unclassified Lentimicrobium]|uniref:prohibitin family protein n=1 Tax=unclassified Lentimicrobium TaxID=2677434 RepID=UPI001552A62E|nr:MULTISPECIES: prohibitin family protein [unclassified Lentimicrobium]NPD45422.1 prohibitin family protein [Lentimicrobium sp. S6]NPD83784.1 prohibitin family protein [Lentimicrobium sp. L6]